MHIDFRGMVRRADHVETWDHCAEGVGSRSILGANFWNINKYWSQTLVLNLLSAMEDIRVVIANLQWRGFQESLQK